MTHHLRLLLASLAVLTFSSLSLASGPKSFDIPEGDAVKTLTLYQQQGDLEILYITDDVRGIHTHAVHGTLDPPLALQTMLADTGLLFQFETDNSFVFITRRRERDKREPPVSAGIWVHAEVEGNPRLAVIRILAPSDEELQEVLLTGTLIHGVGDVTSPLTLLNRNDVKRAGYATVQDAMKALPITFGGGPSEDTASPGNFTRGVAANLRGLGAGATLVLVNGQRQPYSGAQGDFVDLSNLPSAVVERIEVLADGASATYGSDAIAGVVNVILRNEFEGAETDLRYGTARGGASERMLAHLVGAKWSSGHALLAYQFSSRSPLPASARTYAADADKRPFGGSDFRSSSSRPTNILDPRTLLPAYGVPAEPNGTSLTVADLLPNRINLENPYSDVELLSDKRIHNIFATAAQKLGENLEALAELRLSTRDMRMSTFAAQQTLVVPYTNPFYINPYPGQSSVMVDYSFRDELGPVVGEGHTVNWQARAGLHASLSDTWRAFASYSYGTEQLHYQASNYPDPERLRAALASTDPSVAFDPFGPNNPAVLRAIRSVRQASAASRLSSSQLIADGDLVELASGSLKLALGAELRTEQFDIGLTSQQPFSRSIRSTFSELEIPILGAPIARHVAPWIDLSLSGRFEQYSDVGRSFNPRVALRWAPSNSLRLRTSWGTSFRAPKLMDIYDTSQNLAVLVRLPDPSSPLGSALVLARQGNNPDVRPETATTWTVGLDLVPTWLPDTVASISYFHIDYRDRVVIPGPSSLFEILLHQNEWAGVITHEPSGEEINALCDSAVFRGSVAQCKTSDVSAIVDFRVRNLAATRLRGIDITVQEQFDSDYGHFELALNATSVFQFSHALSASSPWIDVLNTVGNPLSLREQISASWWQRDVSQPGFSAALAANYASRYWDQNTGDVPRSVNALTTIDVRAAYRTKSGGYLGDLEVGLGAVNLFDRHPPFVNRDIGYDSMNADPYGRVVNVTLQKLW